MPKLKALSGPEIVKILARFGFVVSYQRGSHARLVRLVAEGTQKITVPIHGSRELAIGTRLSIYRAACQYIDEAELRPFFYTE